MVTLSHCLVKLNIQSKYNYDFGLIIFSQISPYKHIQNKCLPCRTVYQRLPKITRPSAYGEVFKRGLTIYGRDGHLGHVIRTI